MAPSATSNSSQLEAKLATKNNNKVAVVGGSRPRRLSNSQLQRASSDGAALVMAMAGGEEEEQVVRCECCGLAEECTGAYVSKVRDIFCGRWVCGLCAEAVKEERQRMGGPHAPISDALHAHVSLCLNFNCNTRANPAVHVAHAMRQLLRKKSMPTSTSSPLLSPTSNPTSTLPRTASCIPSLK